MKRNASKRDERHVTVGRDTDQPKFHEEELCKVGSDLSFLHVIFLCQD